MVHLVLFETSGNQRYIFATSKRREQVGASELVSRSTTSVLQAVVSVITGAASEGDDANPWHGDTDTCAHWQRVLDSPPIEDNNDPVEIVQATSGRALLLVRDEETAQAIIEKVTAEVLEHAPGLEICGVSTPVDWDNDDLQACSQRLHLEIFPQARFARPAVEQRFLRLPVIEDCATSSWPAARWDADGPDPGPRSAVTAAKRDGRAGWQLRMTALLGDRAPDFDAFELRVEEGQVDRLALVHADVNGLGRILRDLQPATDGPPGARNRAYVDLLRQVSVALDLLVVLAYQQAVDSLPGDEPLRPLPLVLGGDDLTVVSDAEGALTFVATYLRQLEELSMTLATASDGVAPPCRLTSEQLSSLGEAVATAVGQQGRLAACAGVALIKPHYPHATAHELVQQLTASAKTAARTQGRSAADPDQISPCSAVDFEVVHDTADVDLRRLRAALEPTDDVKLTLRPYVITDPTDLGAQRSWAEHHSWDGLMKRCESVGAGVSSSQLHALQELLLGHPDRAERRYQALCARYPEAAGLATADSGLLASPEWIAAPSARRHGQRATGLIDALVAAPFLP